MTCVTPAVGTSRRESRRLLLVLGFLVALGPFTVDLYLPAFPAVHADFRTTAAAVQFTLTATTIGFAVGQLAVGPWSDSIGRRRPLLLATAVHVLGSLGVAAAPTIEAMLVFRVLQGAGAAGSAVVAMAMVRDLFDGRRFVRMAARLGIVTGIAPIVAPFAGSVLLSSMSWRGLFVCIAAYGLAVLAAAVVLLRETLPPVERAARPSESLVARYRSLVTDRRFVGVALIGGLIVSSVFTYMTSSAFLFQTTYGLSAGGYSLVFAVNAVGFVAGAQLSARMLGRITPERLLSLCLPVLALGGFGLVLIPVVGGAAGAVTVVTAAFFVVAGACGPCLQAIGMIPHGTRAGSAGALLGAANFGLAGVTAPLAGALGVSSIAPIGLVMGLTMTLAVIVHRALVGPPGNGGRPRTRC